MKRQLDLADYDVPELTLKYSREPHRVTLGADSAKSVAVMTEEWRMKSVAIETLIHSGDKQDVALQVCPQREEMKETGVDEETNMRLEKFLRRAYPMIEKELSEKMRLYDDLGRKEGKSFRRDSRLVHTLENVQASQDRLEISAVAWNASGVVVAAAYARFDHEEACSHKSMICLWGLYKRDFKPSQPDTIHTPNCISCIEFHPKRPAVFACGSHLGEVLLYDFSRKDEQLIAKTTVDDYYHRDIVNKIHWWAYRPPGKAEINHNILSLGSDGKILLWEVPNTSLTDQLKGKLLLRNPIKGFLMLRKKEGITIPVSGLTMNQSHLSKNMFIVGSEGGSILKAILNPINHHGNTESKVILDLQQTVKFKPQVYPFLLNLFPKNLREVKSHIQKTCLLNKVEQVDSIGTILSTKPQISKLYPNPITYAYEPMSYPITSISDNQYGLILVNGCDGYGRLYLEEERESLQNLEEGYEWGWINQGSRMAGFFGQQWAVIDWINGEVLWSLSVGEGMSWMKSNANSVAIACDKTQLKIIELDDQLCAEDAKRREAVINKLSDLKKE